MSKSIYSIAFIKFKQAYIWSRYNTVQYDTILCAALWWRMLDIDQALKKKDTD